eukprot:6180643-Pleurochrysis_carterae.AAC.1
MSESRIEGSDFMQPICCEWAADVLDHARAHVCRCAALPQDAFLKKHDVKLGFMSAFVAAAAKALQEQARHRHGATLFGASGLTL